MRIIALLICFGFSQTSLCQKLPKNYGNIDTQLFLSQNSGNSLVVAFGGSEGGNSFASEKAKDVREDFLRRGFHFLAVGYFGAKGLPKSLDRISLSAINDTIQNMSKHLEIPQSNILLVGASRGGELVLHLASHFDFMGVIAIVPSNITIPNYSKKKATSSWTLNDIEVPYYQVDEALVKEEGWPEAVEQSLITLEQSNIGVIPIENIDGFVLLTSGKLDKLWPSYPMCEKMIDRLNMKNFKFPFAHIAFNEGHDASGHWPKIFTFLDQQLKDQ